MQIAVWRLGPTDLPFPWYPVFRGRTPNSQPVQPLRDLGCVPSMARPCENHLAQWPPKVARVLLVANHCLHGGHGDTVNLASSVGSRTAMAQGLLWAGPKEAALVGLKQLWFGFVGLTQMGRAS